jgi:hypothetical protein
MQSGKSSSKTQRRYVHGALVLLSRLLVMPAIATPLAHASQYTVVYRFTGRGRAGHC